MNDTLAIKTIKMSAIQAVNDAASGHPGIALGAAPITHTLFTRHLNFDPLHPKWVNRDRFVLSAGHGSALLYAQLRLLGLINTSDLKNFRQYQSMTPGHPEHHLTPGVEATTGPLGQGIAMAVGLAMAQAHLHSKFKEIDHYTYVLCGDGDLEEGVSMEAMSLAGRQKLSKLIILHDSNDVQLDTDVKDVFNENLKMKMEALGFDYQLVQDNHVDAIDQAISQAKASSLPSFIEIKTIIGQDAPQAGTSAVHGAPLGADLAVVKKALKWTHDSYEIPLEVTELYQKTIFARGARAFKNFQASAPLSKFLANQAPLIDFKELKLAPNTATRVASGTIISHLNQTFENWIGGSADLSSSTKATGANGTFMPDHRQGRNILFGVREFAMCSIANGLALHSNLRPFVSTFFVFADYAKPAIRLAALMNLPVTYVFTHDSVFVGEDGPTHQPIEQLAMLRSMPHINVVRPADEKETCGAYQLALASENKPTAIVLTRQNISSLSSTSAHKIQQGPYYVHVGQSPWTLVASGSELASALKIGQKMDLSVVSISNWQGEITWDREHAISIEAGSTYGLSLFAKHNIGIDTFGASAPGTALEKHFGLDLESLGQKISKIIQKP